MSMPEWKLRIFLRVIRQKLEDGRLLQDIREEFPRLTDDEWQELTEALNAEQN